MFALQLVLLSLGFFTSSFSVDALFLNRLQLRAIRIKMRSLTSKLNMMAPFVDDVKKEGEFLSNPNNDECFLTNLIEIPTPSIQPISDSNFDDIIKGSSQGLKIVVFSAKWCRPGAIMERNLLHTLAMEKSLLQSNKLHLEHPTEFYSIDTDTNPESSYMHNVRSIPCTLIFKGSNVVAEIVGTVPSSVIMDQISKHGNNEKVDDNLFWSAEGVNDHNYQ